jgi:hypothetical protein
MVLQPADHRPEVPERAVARHMEGVLLDQIRLAASHVRPLALLTEGGHRSAALVRAPRFLRWKRRT